MGYFANAAKETVYFGALGLVWMIWLIMLVFISGWGAGLVPAGFAIQTAVMLGIAIGGLYVGLRVLGNPIAKLIASVRRDIEHFD